MATTTAVRNRAIDVWTSDSLKRGVFVGLISVLCAVYLIYTLLSLWSDADDEDWQQKEWWEGKDWIKGTGAEPEWRWLLVSSAPGLQGGLGNKLFEICSALGLASTLDRRLAFDSTSAPIVEGLASVASIFPRLLENVSEFAFPENVSKLVPFERTCCRLTDMRPLFEAESFRVLKIRPHYAQSFRYFDSMRNYIRWAMNATIFHTEEDIRGIVGVSGRRLLSGSYFRICIATRRGDFLTSSVHQPSTIEFTVNATNFVMEYYRARIARREFALLVAGDDSEFVDSVLEHVRHLSNATATIGRRKTDPPHLTLLFSARYCDAVLMTASASTFSWWMAYLRFDNFYGHLSTVFFNTVISKPMTTLEDSLQRTDFFPPDWTELRLETNGSVSVVNRTVEKA